MYKIIIQFHKNGYIRFYEGLETAKETDEKIISLASVFTFYKLSVYKSEQVVLWNKIKEYNHNYDVKNVNTKLDVLYYDTQHSPNNRFSYEALRMILEDVEKTSKEEEPKFYNWDYTEFENAEKACKHLKVKNFEELKEKCDVLYGRKTLAVVIKNRKRNN